jgi:hypothetical protein
VLQQLYLIFVSKEHLRRALGGENFQGVRFESENRGRDAEALRLRYRTADESLVPEMYSIEVAERYDRSLQCRTQVTDVAINLHRLTVYGCAQPGESQLYQYQWEKLNSKSAGNRLFLLEGF